MTSGDVPLISTGSNSALSVTIDARVVAKVIARAPKIAHFWLHGFLRKSLLDHRIAWLKSKGPKFGRRGKDGQSRAIKVHRINEGPNTPREDDVIYRMMPKSQRVGSVKEALAGLNQMSAEAFAGSRILRVHEEGEDIRSKDLMAIPVKTRPGTPKKWLAKNPNKKLELRPSKKRKGEAVLYEVTKKRSRGRGRPRKGAPLPVLREKLRLRFILTRSVDMEPTLNFYGMWGQLRSQRDQLWRGAAERMERQLQKGDPRDF
tara:strand:+ start:9558 stop:10337 length:780 start_codon:yes stop_codon:yes gene_type:complete